jgi:hypothetical protein
MNFMALNREDVRYKPLKVQNDNRNSPTRLDKVLKTKASPTRQLSNRQSPSKTNSLYHRILESKTIGYRPPMREPETIFTNVSTPDDEKLFIV